MTYLTNSLAAIMPQLTLLITGSVAILADLFFNKSYRHIAYTVVQMGLIVAAGISIYQLNLSPQMVFNNLVIDDSLGRLLSFFICIGSIIVFLYAHRYNSERANLERAEFYILGLFSILGMLVLVTAHSLLTVYLGLELLSLPLYALVALARDNPRATEAAIKYFVMGAIASGIMLYGMSMIYGATGYLDISEIFTATRTSQGNQTLILIFGMVFVIVGIGFKFAAAPFHMWAPDVYSGAPSSATLFLSSVPKLAAFGMMIRVMIQGLGNFQMEWQPIFTIMAILSLAIGNILAVTQINFKRLLAYSAIAQVGYLFLGFVAGNEIGLSSALFYTVTYVLMTLAAFGFIVVLSYRNFELEDISDLQGLNARDPWLAFLLLIIMFSLAGVPPTVGFFAKLFVIQSLVVTGHITLAIIAMVFAIIGAYYYIRIVKTMYFDAPLNNVASEVEVSSSQGQIVLTINALLLLALGIFPTALLTLCNLVFRGIS